jgi:Uma2 family endonuclease
MVTFADKTTVKKPCLTPQEYLERERKAETKSEYYGGEVVPMAGASKEHNRITFNTSGTLYTQLRDATCEGYANDMRVGVPACDRYFYPDVVIVCGDPRFEDAELDTLLNPTLIVEVLSETTEAVDRGEKFVCYRTLESLTDYVLISQTMPYIEHFSRQPDNRWLLTTAQGLDSRLALPSIDCELVLADIYARIFPVQTPETTSEA